MKKPDGELLARLGDINALRAWNPTGTTHASFCTDMVECRRADGTLARFVPDEFTAYVVFHLCHSFPVILSEKTAMLPQVVANSYKSLEGKVFNLAHLMRSYDPKHIPRDRILGTVMAVEFPEAPAEGWTLPCDEASAPGIKAVAAIHKQAEGVTEILDTWAKGETPFGDKPWTVSMENRHTIMDCGFAVQGEAGLESFAETTPEYLRAQGWVFVPVLEAPLEVAKCLNSDDDDKLEQITCTRICREYQGRQTVFLIGGLNGVVRFKGVGLTPAGKESTARVSDMLASGKEAAQLALIQQGFNAIGDFAKNISEHV